MLVVPYAYLDLHSVVAEPPRMAWLDPPVEPPNVAPTIDPSSPSENNLNYWAARLRPLHDPTPGYEDPELPGRGKEVVFVSCNRVGTEEGELGTLASEELMSRSGTTFVGTSCVMSISSNPPRIELVECCNMSEERVMVAEVT